MTMTVPERNSPSAIESTSGRSPITLSPNAKSALSIGMSNRQPPGKAALHAQMRIELANLHQTLRTTMIFMTHDQIEAMTLAERIVVLNAA